MKKLILVVFFIVLVYLLKNYDEIKIWILNRIILERGILAPSCPWYKISDLFLEDGAGVNLYNDYKEKHGDFAPSKMFNEQIYVVTNVNYIKQIVKIFLFFFLSLNIILANQDSYVNTSVVIKNMKLLNRIVDPLEILPIKRNHIYSFCFLVRN